MDERCIERVGLELRGLVAGLLMALPLWLAIAWLIAHFHH